MAENIATLCHDLPLLVKSEFLVIILKVLLKFERDNLEISNDAKDIIESLADLLAFRCVKCYL